MIRKEEIEQASENYYNEVKYLSDLSAFPIAAFKAGAEWADKTICEWLEDNIWNYIETKSLGDFEILKEVKVSEMVKDIRKEMEMEKL